jgi:large subunit ribosomal protein L9
MKVILITDVPKVGNKYDIKEFPQGYAQNVLISKGLAILATPGELAKLEDRKRVMQKKKEEEISSFKELISSVSGKSITIKAKANDKGHLFKAVSPSDIFLAIKESIGIEIDQKSLLMENIKTIGEHTITIKKGDMKGDCIVTVIASK